MQFLTTQSRLLVAAGIFGAGAVYAAVTYTSKPAYHGPDVKQIQALAERLGEQPKVAANPALSVPNDAAPQSLVTHPATARTVVKHPAAPAPAPAPVVQHAPVLPAAVRPMAAEDPVKNIALMGITHRGNDAEAILADTGRRERETAALGESAFGFTVKAIGDENVVLAQGSKEFTLRLGEKPLALASFEPPSGGSSSDEMADAGFGGSGGFGGFGGPGGRGGFGGFGGRGQGGFGGQRMAFAGGFGNRGGFRQGGFGGNNGGNGGSASVTTFGNNQGGNRFGGGGGFQTNFSGQFGGNRGGFGGGGFGGGNFGGGAGNFGRGGGFATSQFSSTGGSTSATSNPQTARRSGARLTGGAQAEPVPQAISNPQTQRRTGTSGGPAFGSTTGGGYGNTGNRGGMNRPGNTRTGIGGGFGGFGGTTGGR